MKKIKIFNFLVIFILILIGILTPFRVDFVHQLNENRRLMTISDVKQKNIKKTFSKLNNFFNDNYAFRKTFLLTHNLIMYFIFKSPPTRQVIFGKDGWIFYQTGNIIEKYQGIFSLDIDKIDKFIEIQKERKKWLKSKGIEYVLVIAPNKSTIYPEKLPSWVKKKNINSIDLIIDKIRSTTEINVIDGKFLIKEKKNHPIYLSTETHWTDTAAFLVYQKLMKIIKKMIPSTPDHFKIEEMKILKHKMGGGDTTIYLGLQEIMKLEIDLVRLKYKPNFKIIETDGRTHTYYNENSENYNIVVFADSFGGAWTHYLGEHFKYVRWNQTYGFDINDIYRYKPKVVIAEYAERQLWGALGIENPNEVKNKSD